MLHTDHSSFFTKESTHTETSDVSPNERRNEVLLSSSSVVNEVLYNLDGSLCAHHPSSGIFRILHHRMPKIRHGRCHLRPYTVQHLYFAQVRCRRIGQDGDGGHEESPLDAYRSRYPTYGADDSQTTVDRTKSSIPILNEYLTSFRDESRDSHASEHQDMQYCLISNMHLYLFLPYRLLFSITAVIYNRTLSDIYIRYLL